MKITNGIVLCTREGVQLLGKNDALRKDYISGVSNAAEICTVQGMTIYLVEQEIINRVERSLLDNSLLQS